MRISDGVPARAVSASETEGQSTDCSDSRRLFWGSAIVESAEICEICGDFSFGVNLQLFERVQQGLQWQADDIREAASHLRDENAAGSLNRVAARLAARFAGAN